MPDLNLDKINKHLLSPLTEREFKVLQLIYQGRTNNQIADELFVTINTVKVHIRNTYLKLDAASHSTAIVRARELMTR